MNALQKNKILKRIILAVAAAIIVTALAMHFGARVLPVEVAKAEKRTVRAYVAEDGKTRLSTTYSVYMPISGTVRRTPVEAGDFVDKGAVLAHIDPFDIEQDILAIEGQIAEVVKQGADL